MTAFGGEGACVLSLDVQSMFKAFMGPTGHTGNSSKCEKQRGNLSKSRSRGPEAARRLSAVRAVAGDCGLKMGAELTRGGSEQRAKTTEESNICR